MKSIIDDLDKEHALQLLFKMAKLPPGTVIIRQSSNRWNVVTPFTSFSGELEACVQQTLSTPQRAVAVDTRD